MLQQTDFGGHGPKAYFIHGLASDSQSWIANVPELTGVLHCIGIDLPAHGKSVDVAAPESLQNVADQVVEVINTTEPCVLIGHSAGGAVAMLCAARLPVSAMCLIAPVGLGEGVNRRFIDQLLSVQTEEAGFALLRSMFSNDRLVSKMAVTRLLSQLQSDECRRHWQRYGDMLVESEMELAEARAMLSRMNIPIQVHWGGDDNINPCREFDQRLFPADWIFYDNCGHLPHIERWSEYNVAMAKFISGES